jgi:molybdate transport system regulatory protein
MATDPPVMRLHLWLENEQGHMFGLGRALLLAQIGRLGSLRAAAGELNMSYRAAWGKLKQAEKSTGMALVEKVGGNKSGYRLTEEGRALTERYLAWYREVEELALAKAGERFPWPVRSFDDGAGTAREAEKAD